MAMRRQTAIRQLELLVEYMKDHKDLALGPARSKESRALSHRLWAEIQMMLNSEGPHRNAKEWAKVWNDLKCKVRNKIINNQKVMSCTSGGGPYKCLPLTPIEEEVAAILGPNLGPLDISVAQVDVMQEVQEATGSSNRSLEAFQSTSHAVSPTHLDLHASLTRALQHTLTSPIPQTHYSSAADSADPLISISPIASTLPSPQHSSTSPIPSRPTRRRLSPSSDQPQPAQRRRIKASCDRNSEPASPARPATSDHDMFETPQEAMQSTLTRIEVLRAEAARDQAAAALLRAEAEITKAAALKQIAAAIQRFTDKYFA